MKSNIRLKIRFKAIIGLLSHERVHKQRLKINISIKADEFLDYAKLAKVVKACYKEERFFTIEESFATVEAKIKAEFLKIKSLKITVYKLDILKNALAGVSFSKKY